MAIFSSQVHGIPSQKEQEYLDGWQRARAELQNIRSRMANEGTHQLERVKADVLESLLPVADNFQALADHVPQDIQENAWSQGVMHIARDFQRVLGEFGLTPIAGIDMAFNPEIHEAIEQVDSEKEKDMVVAVVQTGWKLGEKVIRPAKVKISA